MKANVNQEGCISCGNCVSICPEVFQFNDAGVAQAIDSDIPETECSSAEDARDACPVNVIDITG